MKKMARMFLLVAALAVGVWLGAMLFADPEPLKRLAFFAICGVLGVVFHQIHKVISKE